MEVNGQFTREKKRCKLVYEKYNVELSEGESGEGARLIRCIPNKDMQLYEIKATYDKRLGPYSYYWLGESSKQVKKRFKERMRWLKVTNIRPILDEDEREKILTDRYKMPLE